jgi:hypothetical protein
MFEVMDMLPLDEAHQETIALEESAAAVLRAIQRGVSRTHIMPSALIMIGLHLMESVVSRRSIGIWLRELSDRYLQLGH